MSKLVDKAVVPRAVTSIVIPVITPIVIFTGFPLLLAFCHEFELLKYQPAASETLSHESQIVDRSSKDHEILLVAEHYLEEIGFTSATSYEVTDRSESTTVISAWSKEPKYIALCQFSIEFAHVRRPDWVITLSNNFQTMKINDEPEIELP